MMGMEAKKGKIKFIYRCTACRMMWFRNVSKCTCGKGKLIKGYYENEQWKDFQLNPDPIGMVRCKSCNHVLTDPISIERGYGKTCFLRVKDHPNSNDFIEDLKFIKLEIKTIKLMLKNGNYTREEPCSAVPIEKIRTTNKTIPLSNNTAKFGAVVSELRELFKSVDSIKDILKPIEGKNIAERIEKSG